MRFLPVIVLMFMCSTAFASFPWMDKFESDMGGWNTTTPYAEMLSTEYNVTAEALSSSSLKLQSTTTTQEIYRSGTSGDGYSTSIVSFWFYDDGESVKSFEMGVQDLVPAQEGGLKLAKLNIAVQDGYTTTATGQYVMTSESSTTPTGVARSTGWHFVEIVTGESGARLILDGSEPASNRAYEVFRPETVIFKTLPIDTTSGAANAVWLDDARFAALGRAYSEQAGPWEDDLENGQGPEYDTFFFASVNLLSGDYNHTADAGSSYSLMFISGGLSGGIKRLTELPWEGESTGTLSFWFYDDGQTTTGYLLGAEAARYTEGPGKIRGNTFAIGVVDAQDAMLGEYLFAKDMDTTSTGFARSIGWHKVEISVTYEGLRMRLDNQDFAGNFFPDFTRLTRASFITLDVGTAPEDVSRVWVDDLKYERTAPVSAVRDWSVY